MKSHLPANRRDFLKGIAGSLTLMPAISRGLYATDIVGESYWHMVSEQFTIKPKLIMLNAANLCPSPHMVREKVARLTEDLDGDVSFQNRAKFDLLREEARRKIASFIGVSDDEIAIVRNTSEANNLIVAGLELKSGDEVVVFNQNHPTNNIAWDVRAARAGFIVKRVSIPQTLESADQILKAFRSAITARTRVLSWTDVSSTSGDRLPSKELCAIARERGVYTHVDGAQTFGALVVNLKEMGCDSYSSSAHKWLMGPKEAGIIYIRRERQAEIWPSVIGVGWGDKVETTARGARKFETLGQRDDAAVSAMGTTIDFHNLIGPKLIENRIRELSAVLKEGCRKIPGATMRTSANPDLSAGVCVIVFEGMNNQKIYDALYTKHGIAGAPTGGVRLCPHIYNTMEEIERTISALHQVVKGEG